VITETFDVDDLYLAIAQLRAAHAEKPYMLCFSSRNELEELLDDALPEDRERFLKHDIRLLYREGGAIFIFPSGEPLHKQGPTIQ
jgi:hypothetical protein